MGYRERFIDAGVFAIKSFAKVLTDHRYHRCMM